MKVLVPVPITSTMLTSCSISEPSASETAWVSSGTYALGDRRILVATHKIYECVQAHSSRTTTPNLDYQYWLEYGPTNKYAAFDDLVSTQGTNTTTLQYVFKPGFFNSIAMFGISGNTVDISIKDVTGGAVFYTNTIDLQEYPLDWYDWGFGRIKDLSKIVVEGILPYPDPEVTITINATIGATAKCGIIAVGDMISLMGDSWGGTQNGASAEPVTYSYINRREDGTTEIVRRHSATDLQATVVMDKANADIALEVVKSVLDQPAVWVSTTDAGYTGLSVYGLGSGSLTYTSPIHAVLNLTVKGLI